MNSILKADLEATKSLIELPKNWTKGSMRTNRFGRCVSKDSPELTCRCLMAAIYDAVGTRATSEGRDRVNNVMDHLDSFVTNHISLVKFNDDPATTHGDVIALLNKGLEA